MTRRIAAAGLLLGGIAAALAACRGSPPAARQVIVITVDTLRADYLGCYGYARPTSPRLDRLAARSTLYRQALTQAPWTDGSFACLLTGYYPSESLCPGSLVNPDLVTVAELAQRAGLATRAIATNPRLGARLGFGRGFENYLEMYRTPAAGEPMPDVAAGRDLPLPDGHALVGKRKVTAEHVTDAALAMLPELKDRDFLLWLWYLDPHTPYFRHPPEYYQGEPPIPLEVKEGERVRVGYSIQAQTDGEPPAAGQAPPPEPPPPPDQGPGDGVAPGSPRSLAQLPLLRYLYEGEVKYVDAQIGRLLDALEAQGLLDRALVVVTSDHGESIFDHENYYGHGRYPYQDCAHVPLIVSWPGGRPGTVAEPVGLIDVMPTVLRHLGIEPPAGLRSAGLTPTGRRGNAPLLVEPTGWQHRALRTGDLKVVAWDDGRPARFSLFDLAADPHEDHDLAGQRPAETERQARALAAALERLEPAPTDLPVPEPDLPAREQIRAIGYVD